MTLTANERRGSRPAEIDGAPKAGKVARNVATLVDAPPAAKSEIRPLAADQVRGFLDSIEGTRAEPLYVLAVALGLRQGELLGLRWQDSTWTEGR